MDSQSLVGYRPWSHKSQARLNKFLSTSRIWMNMQDLPALHADTYRAYDP